MHSDETITVGENGIETAISLQDTARIRTVTLRNTSTGSQEHFVFDKTTGTVYSSITQDTAVLNDVDGEEVAEPMTPYANQQGKTCTRYEFPYSEIKNAYSAAPSAATLIGSLAGKIGIQFASGLGAVVAALGLADVLLQNDEDGGIHLVTVLKRSYDDDGIL